MICSSTSPSPSLILPQGQTLGLSTGHTTGSEVSFRFKHWRAFKLSAHGHPTLTQLGNSLSLHSTSSVPPPAQNHWSHSFEFKFGWVCEAVYNQAPLAVNSLAGPQHPSVP